MFKRQLFSRLNQKASAFIFGPRQTGKTTLIKGIESLLAIDLLNAQSFLSFNSNPDLLERQIAGLTKKDGYVWIDEIQKVPEMLDVVHRCIELYPGIHFLLSGSSARKLRRGAANLLGGRAMDLRLHPLSFFELGEDFDLELVLQSGSLPKIYSLVKLEGETLLARDLLSSYVTTYLHDEIKAEALVRILAAFQHFLEVAAFQFGQEINFSAIAEDCHISDTLVRDYYSILEDTLTGFFLRPYYQSTRKRLARRPKFYFFDNGVTRAILGLHRNSLNNLERGRLFEQYVIQELHRINDYFAKELKFSFWRTSNGAEVDLLIEQGGKLLLAVEVKSASHINRRDLSGLFAFSREHSEVPLCVCAPVERDSLEAGGVEVLTPKSFFERVRDL